MTGPRKRLPTVVQQPHYFWARRAKFHGCQLADLVFNKRGRRGEVARWYAFKALPLVTPSAAAVGMGGTYYVSTRDAGIGRVVFSAGSYEADLMAATLLLVEEADGRSPLLAGRTFVDVGANIGTSLVPALSVFGAQDAVAFEPAPMNFRLLRCNLAANDLDGRVRAFQVALSDRNGEAKLEVAEGNWGDHRLRTVEGLDDDSFYRESDRPTITVPTARFDDIAKDQGIDTERLGMVWMDAQGHEGHILAGAESVTASDVPVVLEYWPYGLRRAQGLDLLHKLIADRYRRVIDVRASAWGRRVVEVHPDDVNGLESRYHGPVGYTDLILLS